MPDHCIICHRVPSSKDKLTLISKLRDIRSPTPVSVREDFNSKISHESYLRDRIVESAIQTEKRHPQSNANDHNYSVGATKCKCKSAKKRSLTSVKSSPKIPFHFQKVLRVYGSTRKGRKTLALYVQTKIRAECRALMKNTNTFSSLNNDIPDIKMYLEKVCDDIIQYAPLTGQILESIAFNSKSTHFACLPMKKSKPPKGDRTSQPMETETSTCIEQTLSTSMNLGETPMSSIPSVGTAFCILLNSRNPLCSTFQKLISIILSGTAASRKKVFDVLNMLRISTSYQTMNRLMASLEKDHDAPVLKWKDKEVTKDNSSKGSSLSSHVPIRPTLKAKKRQRPKGKNPNSVDLIDLKEQEDLEDYLLP